MVIKRLWIHSQFYAQSTSFSPGHRAGIEEGFLANTDHAISLSGLGAIIVSVNTNIITNVEQGRVR
jgi:hypothetical protein